MFSQLIQVAVLGLWCAFPISTARVVYPKTLPCNVTERSNSSEVTVDCTETKLHDIPWGIPRETTNLTLTINHIHYLNSSSFHGLDNLTEIDFRCNCVPVKIGPKDNICIKSVEIEDHTFSGLGNLKALYLDGNQLYEIPEHLPPDLLLLSLEVNHIYSIYTVNLTGLTNVEILYLGQNCYFRNPCNNSYYIEDGAFLQLNNLMLLSLKSNNLSYIPHQLPTHLKELYLYNNNIREVTEEDFKNLTNLEILDISGNCPRCYNAPFPCTPCPNGFPLQIHPDAFKMQTKLTALRLHSNSLTNVCKDWFKSTKNLRVLDLSSNFLSKAVGSFDFPHFLNNLEELDLSFNYELQKYPRTLYLSPHFSELKSLRVFRMRGFVFQQLEMDSIAPLKSLKNLEVVDFGTNFIKTTNLSILMELQSFKIINLADNKISIPSDDQTALGFSAPELKDWSPMSSGVEYDSTDVKEIHYFRFDEYARSCKHKDKELGTVTSLVNKRCSKFGKSLDVSRNNIFFLHHRFLNLEDLRCLNLSNNLMSQSLNGSEFSNLPNLQYLDFSSNRLDLLYSTAFQELQNLVILDISHNDHYFQSEGLTHMLNFTKNLKKLTTLLMNNNQISTSTNTELESESLERLEFRDNRLDVMWRDGDIRYVNYFSKLVNLKILDISKNNLHSLPPELFAGLPGKLSELHLKGNGLKSFNWKELQHLRSLQVLDLSGNSLTTVPHVLSNCSNSLIKLILHKNKIVTLSVDFLKDAFNLKHLDLSFNLIEYVEVSSFPDDVVNTMDMLLLHNNSFACTCKATRFFKWLNDTMVTIPKLGTDVTCVLPEAQKDHPVLSVNLSACQHSDLSIIIYTLMTSFILCCVTLPISSHLFLWDVWYIYHFLRAKLKGYRRLISQPSIYDAFVIYDKEDAAVIEWVTKEMCVQLERRGDRRLTLCLEERDWIPGCPLIDNLSQSIHKSKRTVFILTNKYIKSGSFKTAFYIANQRLMDEKDDVIILIFLEKVVCNSKYLRLRKRLFSKSVLDWPTNPQAQPYFWFCLRNVLATESHKQYNNLFKETL
ncbi:toll-like receptor 7 [Periophthalmus magnuspinnatus]|uniref:toll-like receptor 7 n=1 Tax=Periophthalmus magnuspinnatus TaxID=409849 RepID=UPI00145BA6E4|nr:toll-like receptor 7 [Periophthalmus magnuspinnatus]